MAKLGPNTATETTHTHQKVNLKKGSVIRIHAFFFRLSPSMFLLAASFPNNFSLTIFRGNDLDTLGGGSVPYVVLSTMFIELVHVSAI